MRRRIQEGVEKEDIHICGDACYLSGVACDINVPNASTITSYNRPFLAPFIVSGLAKLMFSERQDRFSGSKRFGFRGGR